MENRYKHKQTGKIATFGQSHYIVGNDLIPIWMIENSNDWEEIKSIDYEILEFRFKGENDFSWKLIKNNIYKSKGIYTRTLDEMFNWETFVLKESPFIYSIKRLSDGKIFTIGDKINCQKDQNQILLEIQIYNEKIRFKMKFQKNHGWDSSYTLDFINKPDKLFTTEDGIDIFDKNIKIFWLDWSLGKMGLNKPSISEYSYNDCCLASPSQYKIFLTKQSAIDYWELNTAKFSWNDIQKAYSEFGNLNSILFDNLLNKLKKI